MRRLTLMVLGLVAVAGFALGCGGGNDGATADGETSPPLTKAEFAKQAEAICAKGAKERRAELKAWQEEFPGSKSERVPDIEANIDEGVREIIAPSVQQQAEELESLAPPAGEEVRVTRMVESLAEAGIRLEENGAKAIEEGGALEFERKAADYGLKACATV